MNVQKTIGTLHSLIIKTSPKGTDLDAGRARQIQVIDYLANSNSNGNGFDTAPYKRQLYDSRVNAPTRLITCSVKNVTSTEIKCRLNDAFRSLGKKDVTLTFDGSMSITRYLSLRVTTNPLVNSIDQRLTIHSGGTKFRLTGYNFNAVQSAYTYVAFRGMWYSPPTIAKRRVSNEVIEFTFPPLDDAFLSLVTSASKQGQQTTKALTTSQRWVISVICN